MINNVVNYFVSGYMVMFVVFSMSVNSIVLILNFMLGNLIKYIVNVVNI